jgi:hypothetical protein
MGKWLEIKDWMRTARRYAANLALGRDDRMASVNDLYHGMAIGELDGPPKLPISKSGQALCAVFMNCRYFRRTEQKAAGINPHSKYRKVYLWEYLPEQDDEGTDRSRLPWFCENSRAWEA